MQKRSSVRSVRAAKQGKRAALGLKEKRRLIQLALCIGLFLAVFLGKGIAPEGMLESGRELLQMIRSDTDFQGVFLALGEAFSQGEPVTQTLGNLAKEVFGVGTEKEQEELSDDSADGPITQAAEQALEELPTYETMLTRLGVEVQDTEPEDAAGTDSETQSDTTVEISAYTGPDLPAGATMDYVDLGLTNTVTPVFGVLTSPFGYRDHPVSGEYLFHAGADLAADTGTPIAAFADGVVEFIGESDAYGLYIQIDHANGVTTFYCHCSALYAQKGDQVSAGQTIAAVGETGNATGPHLHFELRQDGILLNPIYYIETAE